MTLSYSDSKSESLVPIDYNCSKVFIVAIKLSWSSGKVERH